jgi:four helix bundle protein
MARGSLYELQTQTELASSLGFVDADSTEHLLSVSTQVAKLINGLLGVLNTE